MSTMQEPLVSGPEQHLRPPHPLRGLSEEEVLDVVLRDGPVTRPQIAHATGLSKATVGVAVERLQRAGVIATAGQLRGGRGRSPLAYEVPGTAGFVLGIDIGGARVRARAANISGAPIGSEEHETSHDGARAVSSQVIEIAGRVVDRARASHERFLAAAISTPGVVDQVSHRVTSLAYNVSPDGELDPFGALRARFDVPLSIDNNVNLAALGESSEGLARGVRTFAYVSVGAGVGMGLVVDGEIVRGVRGAAGEIGYLPSGRDPYDKRHHLHGELEDEIGAAGILAALQARSRCVARSPRSVHDVFELAQLGDERAGAVVDNVARHLGSAIASVIAVIDPELIVLGGGIGSNPALLGPVRATVAELVPLATRIETSMLGDQAALHGAVAVALREARVAIHARNALSRATPATTPIRPSSRMRPSRSPNRK
jgi:predicted NBD/HSP70 family sugar kinase